MTSLKGAWTRGISAQQALTQARIPALVLSYRRYEECSLSSAEASRLSSSILLSSLSKGELEAGRGCYVIPAGSYQVHPGTSQQRISRAQRGRKTGLLPRRSVGVSCCLPAAQIDGTQGRSQQRGRLDPEVTPEVVRNKGAHAEENRRVQHWSRFSVQENLDHMATT